MTTTPRLPIQSQTNSSRVITTSTQGSTLADILERVLDKGIVIAGDISISIASTELINIRIRLLIASVDKPREMGINWWENDPYLSVKANHLAEKNQQLQHRLENLEAQLKLLSSTNMKAEVPLEVNSGNEEHKSSSENVPLIDSKLQL